jgi:NAD(P)H dehydrogenase (quinone)
VEAFAAAHADETKATADDMEWADGVIFGAPTRFGNVPAQLKNFIDSLGGLWFQGKLANKVYAGMTSAQNTHGGQESTLLALYNSVYHFGGYIVTPGYTDPLVYASGGNPYGVSATANGEPLPDATLEHASYLGKRVTQTAAKLKS